MFGEVEALKERQINEIAKNLCSRYPTCTCIDRDGHCSTPQQHAKIIYGLGYKKATLGHWDYYSTTMMECSVCKKHVPKHRYNFCPECGSKMVPKVNVTLDSKEDWEQITFDSLHTGEHGQ